MSILNGYFITFILRSRLLYKKAKFLRFCKFLFVAFSSPCDWYGSSWTSPETWRFCAVPGISNLESQFQMVQLSMELFWLSLSTSLVTLSAPSIFLTSLSSTRIDWPTLACLKEKFPQNFGLIIIHIVLEKLPSDLRKV